MERWVRPPDVSDAVVRDGVRIPYAVHGDRDGVPTVLLLPTWSLVHSRWWRAQVPYLAKHMRVVTFDGRGNGEADRPVGARRTPTRCSPPPPPCWTRPARPKRWSSGSP